MPITAVAVSPLDNKTRAKHHNHINKSIYGVILNTVLTIRDILKQIKYIERPLKITELRLRIIDWPRIIGKLRCVTPNEKIAVYKKPSHKEEILFQ
jgi:hypothetical protein